MTELNHYSFTRVKRSLGFFALGKLGSGLVGLGLLILVVRVLPRAEYGTYVTYIALFEIVQLVSNLGLFPIAQRYVTDCRINGSQRQLVKLVLWICLGRFITLGIACGGLYLLAEQLLGFIGIPEAKSSFLVYLWVIITEGVSRYLDLIFESLLLQGRAQASIFFRNFAKLCAFSAMFLFGKKLTLINLVELEALTATAGFCLAILFIANYFLMQPTTLQVVGKHRKYAVAEMLLFSIRFYFAQVIGQLYSGDAIKLITSRILGIYEAASFGFSYSIYAILQRYLPAYLLMGMLRPLFIARNKGTSDFTEINNLANIIFKLNIFCLVPVVTFLSLYGIQLSLLISGGKYPEAGTILVTLCMLLILQTLHILLGLVAISFGHAQSALVGTLSGIVGVVLGVYMSNEYGIIALVYGLILSEFLWCGTVWLYLYLSGIRFQLDWLALLKFITIGLFIVFILNNLNLPSSPKPIEMGLLMGLVLIFYTLVAYIIKPFNSRERTLINSILPKPLFVW